MGVIRRYPVPSDIEIAQETELLPITEVAKKMGVLEDEIELYGKYMAKLDYVKILNRLKDKPNGKFITVTCINPTPLGEGKTVTSIGLGQGLAKLGKSVCNALRQPSKGPTFGIKGGACGGGYSQMLPMENINLHFTGDIHATEAAHNLAAAALDAHIYHGNKLGIDPLNIMWPRCVDLNDRALREVIIGLGGRLNARFPRETFYVITVASETAAIHALAMGLKDLRERFGRTVVAFTYDGKPVTCEDLKVAGAMTALMVDAIKPNLVQSTENHPVLVGGFPFANIAHGNNSVLTTMVGLKLCDYVISESGFGADCGFEKLINVKCRQSGLKVDLAVYVVSIRALKQHGGAFHFRPGVPYARMKDVIERENVDAVLRGCELLRLSLNIATIHGVPAVVVINKFLSDTDREIDAVMRYVRDELGYPCTYHEAWKNGGDGCIDFAKTVLETLEKQPSKMQLLYPDDMPLKEKIETIATKLYGAAGVDFSSRAETALALFTKLGYDKLAINMAKTQYSLTHDPNILGVPPKGWKLEVRDARLCAGAGFIYPLTGEFPTMPGFPSEPAFMKVDIDLETGRIKGLF